MYGFRRASFAPLLAILLTGFAGAAMAGEDTSRPYEAGARSTAAAEPATPVALSSADRLTYTTAFDALRRGDLELARLSAQKAQDRVLMGQVEFERLTHPAYLATYDELSTWLETYADLNQADRIYALAVQQRPDGAAEPKRPERFGLRGWFNSAAASQGPGLENPGKAPRIAYNDGDMQTALILGGQIGDWWTVGLAAWRLERFDESLAAFERVAEDPSEDVWVRSGGAFWAARAAEKLNRTEDAREFLALSAHWPATFYGQIASRRLGLEPEIRNQGPRPYEAVVRRAAYRPADPIAVDAGELNDFVQTNAQARRAVALYEIGRSEEAEAELKTGLHDASSSTVRRMWAGLYRTFGARRAPREDATVIDATRYPMPELAPDGGFTIEKALVYAIARKESDFNPNARSGAGAYGIMQVMPATAAHMTGDQSFVRRPQQLLQPAVNMRLGQAYINRMLQMEAFRGDILRAVASYNAGPGPMLGALRTLGQDVDPLLLIETINVPQAREYVEKVVAAYWIYQRMLGGPLKTLDALAVGDRLVPVSLDYVAPPLTTPVEIAAVTTAQGAR